ncbi:hypothetical protein ES703_89051 [subsurface metagenome]
MEFQHCAINQIVFDSVILSAAVDGGVGRVVNFVVAYLGVLAASLERNGAGIGKADVVDVIVGNNGFGPAESDAAGASVVDVAIFDTQALTRYFDALAADIDDFEVKKTAALGRNHRDSPIEPSRAKAPRLERSGRNRECQAANGYVPGRLSPGALNPNNGFDGRGQNLRFAHILSGQRPIDQLAGRAVEIPLSRPGHSFAHVPDDVLFDAERPRRVPRRISESQGPGSRVHSGDADQ